MRLDFKSAFEAILWFGKHPEKLRNQPVSMVLLLREPHFPTLDQLRSAAEHGFGMSFDGNKESEHCVFQAVLFTLMKAGPHRLSFMNYAKAYNLGEFAGQFIASLSTPSQRNAWAEHRAWTAVDYTKGNADFDLKYSVLAKLCAEMIDSNCTGLYIPGKRNFIPNDGSLYEELQQVANSRPLGVNRPN
jgi:hypothetical protein